VRRLFSSFARGLPGLGLLLMRIVAGSALAEQSFGWFHAYTSTQSVILVWVLVAVSVAILLGVWTPLAGALGVLAEILLALNRAGDFWTPVLVGTLAAALALIGPGAWSIDARLFGWKRIDIENSTK
jgi:putative oxidoreductase